MFLGSRFPWEIFMASVRARTLARNFINEFGFLAGYRETALWFFFVSAVGLGGVPRYAQRRGLCSTAQWQLWQSSWLALLL